MKALSLATTDKDKKSLDAKCKELLTKAESIKDTRDWRAGRTGDENIHSLRQPVVSTRKLTTREEIILLEGAKLNGFLFPPFNRPPHPHEFALGDDGQLFTYVIDLTATICKLRGLCV